MKKIFKTINANEILRMEGVFTILGLIATLVFVWFMRSDLLSDNKFCVMAAIVFCAIFVLSETMLVIDFLGDVRKEIRKNSFNQ